MLIYGDVYSRPYKSMQFTSKCLNRGQTLDKSTPRKLSEKNKKFLKSIGLKVKN